MEALLSSCPLLEVYKTIKPYISLTRNYKTKLQNLDTKIQDLKSKVCNLKHLVSDADYYHGRVINEDVTAWLDEAEQLVAKDEERLMEDWKRAKNRCFFGICPSFITRYRLSKGAETEAAAVAGLRSRADGYNAIENISHFPLPAATKPIVIGDPEEFQSRVQIFNQIIDSLTRSDTRLIGLYGMGGVGKTTLAKAVANHAVEKSLFDVAVFCTVTANWKLEKIQEEIIENLHLNISDSSASVRATQLRKSFMKWDKILVVLDDLWEGLDLNDVGIPSVEDHKGCKILLTSRDRNILSTEMGCSNNIPVDVLSEEECWCLFKKMAGNIVETSGLQTIAIQVAEECGGLPVAIVTMARSLKDKMHDFQWRTALRELRNPSPDNFTGMHGKAYKCIEVSYKLLANEELKAAFLLCCQLPRNSSSLDLLKYSMGLGIFQNLRRMDEAQDKVHSLIISLQDSCLLLGTGTRYPGILVHDFVRDVGQSISKRDHQVFVGSIEDLVMDVNSLDKNYTRMWLSGNISQLPQEFKYPQLDLFHFTSKNLDLEVPANFFEGMEETKVLALTNFNFWSTPLPPSLGLLKNLTMLILDGSMLADKAPEVIGKLKANLEILSFAKSNIRSLPVEIGELSKLRILDMSDCSQLEVFPPNVISRLAKLEELYMGGSFSGWDKGGGGNNASLAELKQLAHLTNLEIHIPDAEVMVEDLFSGELKSYRICIGSNWEWVSDWQGEEAHKCAFSKSLKLKLGARTRLDEFGINMLLRSAEALHLEGIGIKNILYELNDEGFPQLKLLQVKNIFDIQYIIDATSTSVPSEAFPMLEILVLINLASLENICNGEFKTLPFSSLKLIEVYECPKLKRLFSFPVAKGLSQLKRIQVCKCENLEEIVKEDVQTSEIPEEIVVEDAASKEIEFPDLHFIELSHLPLLRRFYSNEIATLFGEKIVLPALEVLNLENIRMEILWSGQVPAISSSLQSLRRLRVRHCDHLCDLFSSSMVGSLVQLERLEIGDCVRIKNVIATWGWEAHVKFLKLDTLVLYGLPNLKWFCSGKLIEFPFLNKFVIRGCISLESFIVGQGRAKDFTPHLFNEKVAFPSLVELDIVHMENSDKIWSNELAATSFSALRKMRIGLCRNLSSIFPSITVSEKTGAVEQSLLCDLRNIELLGLPKLKHVLPFYTARDLLRLESLRISNCKAVEYIVAEEDVEGIPCFGFPKLTSLHLRNLPELGSFYPYKHKLECPVLKELEVVHCGIKPFKPIFPASIGEGQLDISIQPSFFLVGPETSNLEILTLGMREARVLAPGRGSGESPCNLFHTVKALNLESFEEESDNSSLPFASILQRFPKLENLMLKYGYLEALFSYKGVLVDDDDVGGNAYLRIKHLQIDAVDDLRHIWDEDHRLSTLVQNIETLKVESSHSLVSLAPSSTSFKCLTSLTVWNCKGLLNIMTSSTAKTLEQLQELRIGECNMLTEIVENRQKDETDRHSEIAFSKLQLLLLCSLKSLTCFCSGNHTLRFTSLTEVIVDKCPSMKTFCHGHLITPKLYEVRLERISGSKRSSWEGNLNTTIQNIYSQMVGFDFFNEPLQFSDFPKLKEVWHDEQLTVKILKDVRTLVVDECAFLSTAVPSHLLRVLTKLEFLKVNNCNSLERVLDLEKLNADDGGHIELLASLLELSLINLPRLNQICNKDPHKILEFRNLSVLKIDNCSSLKNIFTPVTALGFQKLWKMEVRNCSSIEVIITTEAGKEVEVDRVTFPKLKKIILESLPNLNSIYAGNGILEFPSLTEINIDNCPKLDALSILKEQKLEEKEQRLGNKKVVLPLLKILSVDWNETMVEILGSQLRSHIYRKLKGLELKHFPSGCVEFPSEILKKFPNLDQLGVNDALFEEIALHEENQGKGFLMGLKKLKLSKLPKLLHLSGKGSQPWSFLQNLETLEVTECGRLKVLVPSSPCFQGLTELEVSKCHRLVHLITCSTANSLSQLVRMTVAECEMIQEVVTNEENDEAGVSIITFRKMKFLRLDCLLSLKCFYSGNCALMFPSLAEVVVSYCPKMNFFSSASVDTPILMRVKRTGEDFHGRWMGDLNATIKFLCTKKTKHRERHGIPASSSEQGSTVLGFSACVAEQESILKSAELNFEPQLANTGQLLEPTPASSAHRASTSNAHEESNSSSIPSSSTLSPSADLMEKILLKTLTAVRNGLLLPLTVDNLKKQIDRTALELIENDRNVINELKSQSKRYTSKISALDADQEKLKMRLGEIEEEKYEAQVKLEDLLRKLVEKERELEEYMDGLGLQEASSC